MRCGAGGPRRGEITWDDYAVKTGPLGRPRASSAPRPVHFGGDGWTVRNIAFENAAGRVGQAVAVQCLGTGLHFIGCRFWVSGHTLPLRRRQPRRGERRGECPHPFRRLLRRGDDRFHLLARLRRCSAAARSVPEGRFLHHGGLDLPGTGLRADLRRGAARPPPGRHALLAGAFVARSCADGLHRLRNGCAYPAEGWHDWSKPHARKTVFYAEYASGVPAPHLAAASDGRGSSPKKTPGRCLQPLKSLESDFFRIS